MSEKSRLIMHARELGREYMKTYRLCAETTLLAVADTLNMPVSDDVFKSMIGLSSLSGGCGGFCGAIAAIGLRFGQGRKTFTNKDEASAYFTKSHPILRQAVKRVRDQFVNEYGGYLCCDVLTHLFGHSYDLFNPEDRKAFRQQNPQEECPKVTENAAGWTVKAILETEASKG